MQRMSAATAMSHRDGDQAGTLTMNIETSLQEHDLSYVHSHLLQTIENSLAPAYKHGYSEDVANQANVWFKNLKTALNTWVSELELKAPAKHDTSANTDLASINDELSIRQAKSCLSSLDSGLSEPKRLLDSIDCLVNLAPRQAQSRPDEKFLDEVSDGLYELHCLLDPIKMEMAASLSVGPYSRLEHRIDEIHRSISNPQLSTKGSDAEPQRLIHPGNTPSVASSVASSLEPTQLSKMSIAARNDTEARPPRVELPHDTSLEQPSETVAAIPVHIRSKTSSATRKSLEEVPSALYEALRAPHEIRLLKLSPRSAPGDSLSGEFVVVPLSGPGHSEDNARSDRSTPFDAISWIWGDRKRDKVLSVTKGGVVHDVMISSNLAAGLDMLRSETTDRYLWVDAVCIDWRNVDEYSRSAAKLAATFEAASHTCAWLGPGNDVYNIAFDFAHRLVKSFMDIDSLWADASLANSWVALMQLMDHEWFRKRWVVQEIVLSKALTIYCGKNKIQWQDLAIAIQAFVRLASNSQRVPRSMGPSDGTFRMPCDWQDMHALGAAVLVDLMDNGFRKTPDGLMQPAWSLLSLVSKFGMFECSERRDTIYSLLALARETRHRDRGDHFGRLSPEARKLLINWCGGRTETTEFDTDYSRPVKDVFADFVCFAISTSLEQGSRTPLDILCQPWAPYTEKLVSGSTSSGQRTTDGTSDYLPSWMQTQNRAPFERVLWYDGQPRVVRTNADLLVGLPSNSSPTYNASGTKGSSRRSIKTKPRRQHIALQVEGFVLDNIGGVSDTAMLGNLPPSWVRFASLQGLQRPSGREVVGDDFLRTLVADRSSHGQQIAAFYPKALREVCRHTLGGRPLESQHMIGQGTSSLVVEVVRRMQNVIWNRRLIRTHRGEQLGLAPDRAQDGDLICIMHGCSVPVVLRKIMVSREQSSRERDEDMEVAAVLIQRFWRKRTVHSTQGQSIRRRLSVPKSPTVLRRSKSDGNEQGYRSTTAQAAQSELVGSSPTSEIRTNFRDEIRDTMDTWVTTRRVFHSLKPFTPPPAGPTPATAKGTSSRGQARPASLQREANIYYEFIGECFVYGMMDGEAIEWQRKQMELPEKTRRGADMVFELR